MFNPMTRNTIVHRILLIEDESNLLRLYSKVLESGGFEVYQARTVDTARKLLAHYQFDAVISDVHLGKENALAVLGEYRDILHQHGTPLIMVSADESNRRRGEEIGVDFFMRKPISPAELATVVYQQLNHRAV
jgi:DNA-binding response OmpR family regulator